MPQRKGGTGASSIGPRRASEPPRPGWYKKEKPAEKKKRASTIRRALKKEYPDARCALNFSNPLELVVATVLSAQCTDAMVNKVTESLFQKYRTPEDYMNAPPGRLEADIRPTGFFNQKARSLRGLSRVMIEEFAGEVPRTMEEITRLPGVARKTGNVVLGNAYGHAEGIAVDTHVGRLSWRLGFTEHVEPVKIEAELMALFPKSQWMELSYLLIDHGRAICQARRPRCEDCVVARWCPAARLPETGSKPGKGRLPGKAGKGPVTGESPKAEPEGAL